MNFQTYSFFMQTLFFDDLKKLIFKPPQSRQHQNFIQIFFEAFHFVANDSNNWILLAYKVQHFNHLNICKSFLLMNLKQMWMKIVEEWWDQSINFEKIVAIFSPQKTAVKISNTSNRLFWTDFTATYC